MKNAWRWALAYAVTAVVFLGMDAVWLGTVTASLYRPAIGGLMADTVDWVAAAVFYPLYIAGLVFFVVVPAVLRQHVREALWRGALLGLMAYGTYDLTNQATLKDWPWMITMIDLAWGACVSGVSAWAAAAATVATSRRATRTSGR